MTTHTDPRFNLELKRRKIFVDSEFPVDWDDVKRRIEMPSLHAGQGSRLGTREGNQRIRQTKE